MLFAQPFVVFGFTVCVATGALMAGGAAAQQIYRSVGPDGRVTFSDTPPLAGGDARTTTALVVPLASGTAGDLSALPFELRQVASRYPVTLYSGPACAPCVTGRAMLMGRGVPFTERTVSSNEDIDALKRLAEAPSLPLLTIGSQQLKGYSDIEWTQFLDAAGYPKTSLLPASYQPAPATPLVAAHEPQAPARPSAARRPAAAAPAAAPNPTPAAPPPDSSGIRF